MPDMQRNSKLISRDLRISNCTVMGVAHPQDNPGDLIPRDNGGRAMYFLSFRGGKSEGNLLLAFNP